MANRFQDYNEDNDPDERVVLVKIKKKKEASLLHHIYKASLVYMDY